MKLRLWMLLAGMLLLIVGCQATGKREIVMELFGNRFVFTDKGEDYKAGFDEDSSIVEWVIGSNKPAEKADDEDDG